MKRGLYHFLASGGIVSKGGGGALHVYLFHQLQLLVQLLVQLLATIIFQL